MPKTKEIEEFVKTTSRRLGALNRSHILPSPSARKEWVVTPPIGCAPDDLCVSDYWKHVAAEVGIQPNDLVSATAVDGKWYATYLVIHVGPQHAKLQLLHAYNLEPAEVLAKKTQTHEVKWMGPAHKWVVSRISDKETIKHGFETADLAATWLNTEAKAA